MYSRLTEVVTRHLQVSTCPGYTVVTRHTTDVSPYRTIGTASSKSRLETTGPEFTSPGGRILTLLPCRRCGGALAGGSVAASRQHGAAGKYQWNPGVASGKKEAGGAHRGRRSTVWRCKRLQVAAFNGGRGAPMINGGWLRLLQHR
jgi:hypothetical protein